MTPWMLLSLLCASEAGSLGQLEYPTPYTFSTLAGNAGYGTADGSGSSARFNSPQNVAVDRAGNIFVADAANNTIRKITPTVSGDLTNWVVSTIAGVPGESGSADGIGSAARFDNPHGLAADAAGNLYLADFGNQIIRQITPLISGAQTNWAVTTLAGSAGNSGSADGAGPAARFHNPMGIAVDARNNLYVADDANHAIRMISMGTNTARTNWNVATIAGLPGSPGVADGIGTAAKFENPMGVALDPAGNLYVTDYGAGTIRTIVPRVAGMETNWAVTTIAGSPGDFGSRDGVGSDAQFYNPFGITVGPQGELFVVDSDYNTVRSLTPTVSAGQTNWVVSTIAGTPGNTGSADGTGAAAEFNYPNDIAADAGGNLYVADTFNNTIRKIALSGSPGLAAWQVTTIAGLAGGSGSDDGTGAQARFNAPSSVAIDRVNNLWVADAGNCTIRLIAPVASNGQTNWVASTVAGSPEVVGSADGTGADAEFDSPGGIALDAAGNVWVADSGNNTIRSIRRATSGRATNWVVNTIAGSAGNAGLDDGEGAGARFNSPIGLAADGAGTLYVADAGNNAIREITSIVSSGKTNWIVATIAGSAAGPGAADGPGIAARFDGPAGVALDGFGNLFVADTGNHTIRQITPSQTGGETIWMVTTLAGSAGNAGASDGAGNAANFNSPAGLALDPAGDIYVADEGNNVVRKLTPPLFPGQTNWIVTTIAGLAGNFGSADGTGSAARFYAPSSTAVGADGRVYVADLNNDTIRVGSTPALLLLATPVISSNILTLGFRLIGGAGGSFELLDAESPAGPWNTNRIATLTTNAHGPTYTFTAPIGPDPAHFYRIQTP